MKRDLALLLAGWLLGVASGVTLAVFYTNVLIGLRR